MRNILVLFVVLLVGCKNQQDVEFVGIKNTEITGSDGSTVIVNFDALMFNPNKAGGKIRDIDVVVFYQGKENARVDQVEKIKVKGNTRFSIPLVMSVDLNKLNTNFLSQISSILSGKGIELHFVGNVKVSIHGFGYKVPVDHKESITF